MPQISFLKNISPIEVQSGDILMKSLLAAKLPVASSCHGEGVCSKCHVRIIKGSENLSAETPLELGLKARNKIPAENRISCQTMVLGPVTVDTNYW